MERIVIQVEGDKAAFFRELIDSFDFVEIVKVDNIVEPRVYPAANFEIRPKNKVVKIDENVNEFTSLFGDTQNSNKKADTPGEGDKYIKQIRDAMSEINRLREKNRE